MPNSGVASLFLVCCYPKNYYEKPNQRDGIGKEKYPLVLQFKFLTCNFSSPVF